jgi:RNA polymerase sigma factor (sigma-70 family)
MGLVSEQPSDAAALAASRRDPERFAILFDRHSQVIYGYLQRRIGATHADDLTAETFLTAFRLRHRYDASRSDARPWLFGIATKLLRRHRRRERRELLAYARNGVDPARAHVRGPEGHLERQALDIELARTLASLSSKDRDVLLLYAWADLSYEEIGQALGIPVGTVRSRLFRARRQARELLSGKRAIQGEPTVPMRRTR